MFKASSTDLCFVLLRVGELVYLTFPIIGSCNSTGLAHPNHFGLTDSSCIQNAVNLPGEGRLFPPPLSLLWDSVWFVKQEKTGKRKKKKRTQGILVHLPSETDRHSECVFPLIIVGNGRASLHHGASWLEPCLPTERFISWVPHKCGVGSAPQSSPWHQSLLRLRFSLCHPRCPCTEGSRGAQRPFWLLRGPALRCAYRWPGSASQDSSWHV